MNRFLKWPLVCGWLALALVRTALAADATYLNNGIVSYPGTQSYPPVIDATNFVNNGSFTINYTIIDVASLVQPFYETSDTQNYTNSGSGVMVSDTGFRFDNQASSAGTRTMSANFFNAGYISCASANNTGDPYLGLLGSALGYAQCLISATNIVNPGTLDVGVDGLIQVSGQNVDLSHGVLNVEGGGANAFGIGLAGFVNTNYWDPNADLWQNYAESAEIPIYTTKGYFFAGYFYYEYLTNSTAYIKIDQGISNNIIRAVFIEDNSPTNINYNVYFDTANIGFGNGSVTIEWIGSYLDAASGNTLKNYLYLNDNYIESAVTNNFLNGNGIPINFTFTASPTPLPIGVAAPAGFQNVFLGGSITNIYSFADVQLTSTTFSTNSLVNPNPSLTNMPGRIVIAATNELNLAYSQITGLNYLSVLATNQFDGTAGARIQTPYSDINVGVTNGFLSLTNLITPQVPNWGGEVQAWSTRWLAPVTTAIIVVDTNGVASTNFITVTNDFRVLIVGSVVSPTTRAQVQDLILHGTNSMVISDTYNIMRTFAADAQNLTLTTNGPGVGATSLDGEINFVSPQIYWQSSLPNLRNLTNNGAIRMQNLANFGNPLTFNTTASTPAVAATGTLSRLGLKVGTNDSVTLGTNKYVFVGLLTNTLANQIKIATNFNGSISNLMAAINGTAGAGTAYSTPTKANPLAAAILFANNNLMVSARTAGAAGNAIATWLTSANLTWNGNGTLTGGIDYVPASTNVVTFPYDNFINSGLVSDQGSIIWAGNFLNSGTVSNGVNSFTLQSVTTTLTNGAIVAGGDIAITASSLVTSNLSLQAGQSLTLRVTNLLTDDVPNGTTGLTNPNVWMVQSSLTTSGGSGLNLPLKPVAGDLLGTTISNTAAAPNRQVVNVWAGQDRGVSANGYTNNAAIGQLVLDAQGATSQFKFSGAGTNNAIYVDELVFLDQATNGIYDPLHIRQAYDFSQWLAINPNMMVYFAQAMADGFSIAEKIDAASKAGRNNGGRLRWVPQYTGYFSSTNLVYPGGLTNTVNAALAASTTIDSNGNGIPNASDPTPFFLNSQLQFSLTLSNAVPRKMIIAWNSIPSSTNHVFYKTNVLSANWLVLTNFVSPATVPPVGGWPISNVVYDLVTNQARFYQVRVDPAN